MHTLCNLTDMLWVTMEMESVSWSDHCVSGSARGFASAGSSFRRFGYHARRCFTRWQRSQQKVRCFILNQANHNYTLVLMCRCKCHWCCCNDIFQHLFLQGMLREHACFGFFPPSSTLFHIHTPTHSHTSNLPAVNHSPTLLTSEQLILGTQGVNALLRGTKISEAEGEESFSYSFYAVLYLLLLIWMIIKARIPF